VGTLENLAAGLTVCTWWSQLAHLMRLLLALARGGWTIRRVFLLICRRLFLVLACSGSYVHLWFFCRCAHAHCAPCARWCSFVLSGVSCCSVCTCMLLCCFHIVRLGSPSVHLCFWCFATMPCICVACQGRGVEEVPIRMPQRHKMPPPCCVTGLWLLLWPGICGASVV
jgi:hypothetical protein